MHSKPEKYSPGMGYKSVPTDESHNFMPPEHPSELERGVILCLRYFISARIFFS